MAVLMSRRLAAEDVAGAPPWPALLDDGMVRGRLAGIDAATLGGADVLDAYAHGAFLPLRICRLLGMVLSGVGNGQVTAMLPASPWLLSSRGVVPAAVVPLVADLATNVSMHYALPLDTLMATVRLALTFHRPGTSAGGAIVATGRPSTVTRTAAAATLTVRDASGEPFVDGTTCDVILSRDAPAWTEGETVTIAMLLGAAGEPEPEHPLCNPPQGEVFPASLLAQRSGLELLHGRIAGDLPQPPISHLMGIAPVAAEAGWSRWTMATSWWLQAILPGRLYGGCTALLAATALEGALETLIPSGAAPWLTRMTVRFVRPVLLDGRSITADARVLRRDGDHVSLRAEVRDGDGVAATATGEGRLQGNPPECV